MPDYPKFEELRASGDVQWIGIAAVCWLGVPLMIEGKPIGLIAVQSYTPDTPVTADATWNCSTSCSISTIAQCGRQSARRLRAESLRLANLQLEHASQTDPLTGLHNRRYLTTQIPVDMAFYDREQERSTGRRQ